MRCMRLNQATQKWHVFTPQPPYTRRSISERVRHMEKHTTGPWRTGDVFNTVFGPPNGNPSPDTIATVFRGNRGNAYLIAAAPELLAQLEKALAVICNPEAFYRDRVADDIRKIIAKATGTK